MKQSNQCPKCGSRAVGYLEYQSDKVGGVTTPRSVAVLAALRAGVPVTRRDVLLDAGLPPEEMRSRWDEAIATAKEKGKAVLVCHGRKDSFRTILDLVPALEAEGIRAVTVDELIAERRAP